MKYAIHLSTENSIEFNSHSALMNRMLQALMLLGVTGELPFLRMTSFIHAIFVFSSTQFTFTLRIHSCKIAAVSPSSWAPNNVAIKYAVIWGHKLYLKHCLRYKRKNISVNLEFPRIEAESYRRPVVVKIELPYK